MRFQIENKEFYFEIKYEGFFDQEMLITSLGDEKILEEMRALEIDKVLIDLSNVDLTTLKAMDRYYLGKEAALFFGLQGPFKRMMKAAIVMPHEFYDGFAETVARNRGTFLRLFFDRSEALEWLL